MFAGASMIVKYHLDSSWFPLPKQTGYDIGKNDVDFQVP